MTREELIRNLKYTMKKHENDKVPTFGTNISIMCKSILDYLEQEPCEDAISKSDVFEILGNLMSIPYDFDRPINEKDVSESMNEIVALPPVTPARPKGHWINIDKTHSKCDRCGAVFEIVSANGEANYCPNCGCLFYE